MMDTGNTIGYLLQHVSAALARQSDQVLREQLGIGFSQFKILMSLQNDREMQQKYIADTLGQTEASISRQIKLMHNQGLLTTTINPRNRREHITRLTEKGERLMAEALRALNNYHSPMFELLTDLQKEQLLGILEIMHIHVCQPAKSGACHRNILA